MRRFFKSAVLGLLALTLSTFAIAVTPGQDSVLLFAGCNSVGTKLTINQPAYAANSITGTAPKGAVVSVYKNSSLLGTTTADATTGVWTYALSTPVQSADVYTATTPISVTTTAPTYISEGLNVNHALTQGFEASGGTSFGRLSRIRLVSPVAFQCVRAVYATFWKAGTSATSIFDQDYPAPFNVQTAIELPPYAQARTGIPVRTGSHGAQLTWNTSGYSANGGLTWAYGGAGTNPNGYVVSDRYCAPSIIPANTEFGLETSTEAQTSQPLTYAITALSSSGNVATATMASTTGLYLNEQFNVSGASVAGYNNQAPGIGSTTGYITSITATTVTYNTAGSNLAAATTATGAPYVLPANAVSSSAYERYEGTTAATSSAGSFVATNAVANNTSTGNWTTSAGGSVSGHFPAFLLIDVPGSTKEVALLGDSVEFGVSAGGATNVPSRDGDSMGYFDHGISWLDRGVQYNNSLLYVNFGKGSDGAKFDHVATNWAYTRNLIALANPTHIVNAYAFNDQGTNPFGVWTASNTTFYRGTVASHSGNYYVELAGTSGVPTATCTTGATGPVGTTVGQYETDGTCQWAFIAAVNGTNYGQQGIGWNMVVNDLLRSTVPTAKLYNTTMMPNAALNSPYQTLANQTVTATACTTRNNFDSYMQTRQDLMGWTSVFDINTYIENDPVNHDCYWVVDGTTPNLVTTGAHPNSYGYGLAAGSVPSGSFQ